MQSTKGHFRPPAQALEYLAFKLGREAYGVDTRKVQQLRTYGAVARIANAPEYVKGVLNLRGAMVPIIDLRCRFGQGLTEATPLHIMIIVQVAGRPVGLLADRVLDIVAADAGEIQPVPDIAQTSGAQFLSGLVTIDGAMIALINLPTLVAYPT